MQIEQDAVEVRGGVRGGETLGSPVALWIANRDYANWEKVMTPRRWTRGPPSSAGSRRRGRGTSTSPAASSTTARPARRARARLRPRDGGAGGGWRLRQDAAARGRGVEIKRRRALARARSAPDVRRRRGRTSLRVDDESPLRAIDRELEARWWRSSTRRRKPATPSAAP
jgi:hypothetical protein